MIKQITRLSSHTYELPVFQVTENGLEAIEPATIQFCSEDAHPGFIAETLIQVLVEHLESVNEPSDYTTAMIAHLRTALDIADERDREKRGVLQTYNK